MTILWKAVEQNFTVVQFGKIGEYLSILVKDN